MKPPFSVRQPALPRSAIRFSANAQSSAVYGRDAMTCSLPSAAHMIPERMLNTMRSAVTSQLSASAPREYCGAMLSLVKLVNSPVPRGPYCTKSASTSRCITGLMYMRVTH